MYLPFLPPGAGKAMKIGGNGGGCHVWFGLWLVAKGSLYKHRGFQVNRG